MDLATYFFDHLKKYKENIFTSHASYLLDEILDPWAENFLSNCLPPFKDNQLPIGIIIYDRPSDLLRFTILNTIVMGRLKIRIKLFTTSRKLDDMKDLFSDVSKWVDVFEIGNREISTIDWNYYQQIMKDPHFWQNIVGEKLLIFQADTLLIEPIDFSMFQYDYVGAPWSRNKFTTFFPVYKDDLSSEKGCVWVTSDHNSDIDYRLIIGNGGLSIRNRSAMEKICLSEPSSKEEPEDVFFSKGLYRCHAHLPTLEVARRFSCECEYFISIGSHASFRYLSADRQAEIYDRHIKNLISLISATNKNSVS